MQLPPTITLPRNSKAMPARQMILIPVTIGEGYQAGLLRRLQEYGIKQREICREMQIEETQFSRWVARPSEVTGRAVAIGIENVTKIEMAILAIRNRRPRVKPLKGTVKADDAELPRAPRQNTRQEA